MNYIISGCNWYGFGAMFFGCLSMVIHGSISLVRCLPIVSDFGHQLSLRRTLLLLSGNVLYSGTFAIGEPSLEVCNLIYLYFVIFTLKILSRG